MIKIKIDKVLKIKQKTFIKNRLKKLRCELNKDIAG